MLKSLDDPQTAGLILEEQANALKSILGDASVLKLIRVSNTLVFLCVKDQTEKHTLYESVQCR